MIRTEIELRDPRTLTPYPHNNKIHPPEQIRKLAQSIAEHGFDQPIVVDGDGVIIKGHGRLAASLEMGLTQVPVIVASDLTPEQVRAARLADNAIADDASLDLEAIVFELTELAEADYDLSLTGFDPDELTEFLTESEVDTGWQPPAKGEEFEDAEPEPESRSSAEDRFPLAIVLSWAEHQRWRDLKTEHRAGSDKAMLLKLLEP